MAGTDPALKKVRTEIERLATEIEQALPAAAPPQDEGGPAMTDFGRLTP